jgi:hypothetical protein
LDDVADADLVVGVEAGEGEVLKVALEELGAEDREAVVVAVAFSPVAGGAWVPENMGCTTGPVWAASVVARASSKAKTDLVCMVARAEAG